ncbi:MAG: DUF3822 family protein [Paludibacter sp.]|nr:DUF3822 family protein [Paludibacter sp.]
MEQPIDLTMIKQYLLSIRLSAEGFSISVFDESSEPLSSKRITKSLFSLSSEEIIKLLTPETLLNYQSVRLICESDTYTFVPAPLFKLDEAADLLHLQFKPVKTDQIILNRIPKWDTVNVFSIPKTLHIALTQLFPDAIIEHHLTYFLCEYVKQQNENSVYIEVRNNIMDVVVVSNGALQLLNSFSFNTPEDFTYYILNLFDKLQLDTENCSVILFNAEKKPELQKMLELYLEVIKG